VATKLQTGYTVTMISKLSSVPKLHVGRSSTETLRPPPLIYWAPSRLQAATFLAKQTPCWWSSSTGGHRPPSWLHRCNNFQIIKRSKAACRQVPLRNAETSTTDVLCSKEDPGSHLCGKAENLLVEVLDRWLRASKLAPTLEYFLLSSIPKLYVDRSSFETLRPPPLIYWTPSRIHADTSVPKQTLCWWRSWTGGHRTPNWLHRCNNF